MLFRSWWCRAYRGFGLFADPHSVRLGGGTAEWAVSPHGASIDPVTRVFELRELGFSTFCWK